MAELANMKKKMRKFAEGGFSAAQEEWLGGADRTDPYILARMRSAVPDEAKSTSRDFDAIDSDMVAPSRNLEPNKPVTKTVTKTSVTATPKAAPNVTPKPVAETPEEYKARMEDLSKKQALENVSPEDYFPNPVGLVKNLVKRGLKTYTPDAMKLLTREPLKLGREMPKLTMKKGGSVKKMASGGKVKSASSRADGCAVRGKTRA
jgi:hypothetical protein